MTKNLTVTLTELQEFSAEMGQPAVRMARMLLGESGSLVNKGIEYGKSKIGYNAFELPIYG